MLAGNLYFRNGMSRKRVLWRCRHYFRKLNGQRCKTLIETNVDDVTDFRIRNFRHSHD